jgi:hypothetical protein
MIQTKRNPLHVYRLDITFQNTVMKIHCCGILEVTKLVPDVSCSATNLCRYTKGKDKPRTVERKAMVGVKADNGSGSQKSLHFLAVNMLKA